MTPSPTRVAFLEGGALTWVLTCDHPGSYVIGGNLDLDKQEIVFILGDMIPVTVPFSFFEPNAKCSPDFEQFEIVDHGTAVKFGDYECSTRHFTKKPTGT